MHNELTFSRLDDSASGSRDMCTICCHFVPMLQSACLREHFIDGARCVGSLEAGTDRITAGYGSRWLLHGECRRVLALLHQGPVDDALVPEGVRRFLANLRLATADQGQWTMTERGDRLTSAQGDLRRWVGAPRPYRLTERRSGRVLGIVEEDLPEHAIDVYDGPVDHGEMLAQLIPRWVTVRPTDRLSPYYPIAMLDLTEAQIARVIGRDDQSDETIELLAELQHWKERTIGNVRLTPLEPAGLRMAVSLADRRGPAIEEGP